MHGIAKDFRFAARQLFKAPGFTLTVVLMLGLGIGVTTAIFSLIEGILLRPLPFQNPDRLVLLGDHLASNTRVGSDCARNRHLRACVEAHFLPWADSPARATKFPAKRHS
jgi:hypothetical protein